MSPIGAGRGRGSGVTTVRFPRPPAAPGVRLSPHRALHVSCPDLRHYVAGGFGVHGAGMLLPR
jgi:hypothetical protein